MIILGQRVTWLPKSTWVVVGSAVVVVILSEVVVDPATNKIIINQSEIT